jgi:hypothetical protein
MTDARSARSTERERSLPPPQSHGVAWCGRVCRCWNTDIDGNDPTGSRGPEPKSRPRAHGGRSELVCSQIVGHDGRSGKSPYSSIDVERLFAAIRLLDERETLEVAPFVTWHPSVTAWRQRRFGAGHEARALDDEIRNMMRSSGMRSFGSRAASIIRDIAQAEIALAATTDIYSVLASAVLLCLRRHVRPVKEPTYLDDLRGHR